MKKRQKEVIRICLIQQNVKTKWIAGSSAAQTKSGCRSYR